MFSARHCRSASASLWLAACVLAILTTTATSLQAETASSSVVSLERERLAARARSEERRARGAVVSQPRPEAKKAKVPFVIQDAFPGYHGVAWYWREFAAPANPQPEGRYLLRFWAVDYMADVWVNGVAGRQPRGRRRPVRARRDQGRQAGGRRIAWPCACSIRPTSRSTASGWPRSPTAARTVPIQAGASWNMGGIMDSVELLFVPAVRVEDVFVRPDWKTGVDSHSGELSQRDGPGGEGKSGVRGGAGRQGRDAGHACASIASCRRATRSSSRN